MNRSCFQFPAHFPLDFLLDTFSTTCRLRRIQVTTSLFRSRVIPLCAIRNRFRFHREKSSSIPTGDHGRTWDTEQLKNPFWRTPEKNGNFGFFVVIPCICRDILYNRIPSLPSRMILDVCDDNMKSAKVIKINQIEGVSLLN